MMQEEYSSPEDTPEGERPPPGMAGGGEPITAQPMPSSAMPAPHAPTEKTAFGSSNQPVYGLES